MRAGGAVHAAISGCLLRPSCVYRSEPRLMTPIEATAMPRRAEAT